MCRLQAAGTWAHSIIWFQSVSFCPAQSQKAACQACGFRTTLCLSIVLRDVGYSQSVHTLQTGLSKCKHWVVFGLKQKKKVPKDFRMGLVRWPSR